MLIKLCTADPTYRDLLKCLKTHDSFIAVLYYVFVLAAYYLTGRIMALTGYYFGALLSILVMLVPILLCRHALSSIGLCRTNLKRSLTVAGITGLLLLLAFAIIPGAMAHRPLLPLSRIARNLFYYLIIIGLSEEICFRGFIQPRLFPLFKREWLTITISGLLFVIMHYPFQMAARNMTFTEYWPQFIENAPMQFIWHLVFTWLYRRYGNIFSCTLLHGLIDMSMGIFA